MSDTVLLGQEMDLLHPWIEGDSVLVGTLSIRGLELRDSDPPPITVRLPADGWEAAGPREFSPGRTALLALTLGACGFLVGLLLYSEAMDDWELGDLPTIF